MHHTHTQKLLLDHNRLSTESSDAASALTPVPGERLDMESLSKKRTAAGIAAVIAAVVVACGDTVSDVAPPPYIPAYR